MAAQNNDDTIIWGAENIARAVNLVRADGTPNARSAFHKLQNGFLPGKKIGNIWVSTASQLRAAIAGE
jgi:hypothetical protein